MSTSTVCFLFALAIVTTLLAFYQSVIAKAGNLEIAGYWILASMAVGFLIWATTIQKPNTTEH